MTEKVYLYLSKKYPLPKMGTYTSCGGEFLIILERLDKNGILDKTDKQWMRNKGMFIFLEFIDDWEKKGKPNFDILNIYKTYIPHYNKKEESIKRVSEKKFIKIDNDTIEVPIKEIKTKVDRKKQDTFKNTTKQITEKTTGYNLRKSHMPLHYKQVKIDEHIKNNVINLKPTNIPKDINSIFLPKIWKTINSSIQKDIEELYKAYKYSLWTSTILMAYRTLENILKVHIKSDLKKDPGNSITKSIQVLEESKYDSNLLKKLSGYKDERNEYMHGNKRAGAGEVKKIVSDIISITMHIHNIKS